MNIQIKFSGYFCLLQETGIDMNYVELYKLIETLDKNKDGEINYR